MKQNTFEYIKRNSIGTTHRTHGISLLHDLRNLYECLSGLLNGDMRQIFQLPVGPDSLSASQLATLHIGFAYQSLRPAYKEAY